MMYGLTNAHSIHFSPELLYQGITSTSKFIPPKAMNGDAATDSNSSHHEEAMNNSNGGAPAVPSFDSPMGGGMVFADTSSNAGVVEEGGLTAGGVGGASDDPFSKASPASAAMMGLDADQFQTASPSMFQEPSAIGMKEEQRDSDEVDFMANQVKKVNATENALYN